MKGFPNDRAKKFIDAFPICSIESESDTLSARAKFNFSYFDVQESGQNFDQWDHGQLTKLLNKLKEYSKEPLAYWMNQGPYVNYGNFPRSSDFFHPKHVPHEAQWGRFRLEASVRLIGFVVPKKFGDVCHVKTKVVFDPNTFYIVFLDRDHLFYKTEKP